MDPQDINNGFKKLRTRIEQSNYTDMHYLPDDFWGCIRCGLVVWNRDIHTKQCPLSEEKDIEVQKPTGCLLCGNSITHHHDDVEVNVAGRIYEKHYAGDHTQCHTSTCSYR